MMGMNPDDMKPDENSPLADDLDASVTHLADEVDLSQGPSMDSPMPGQSIGAEQAINFLRPLLQQWATESPESCKTALAVMHLETGALLEKHDDRDPGEIVR